MALNQYHQYLNILQIYLQCEGKLMAFIFRNAFVDFQCELSLDLELTIIHHTFWDNSFLKMYH